jgi:hypothetical protein
MSVSDTKIVPAGPRFDIDTDNSSGLSLRVKGGVYLDGLGFKSAPNATLTLVASATNYIEVNDAGVIGVVTAFTAGYTRLYAVTTNASVVTGIADWRGAGALDLISRAENVVPQALTASGAISSDAHFVTLNSTTPLIAATIAAPAAGRFLVITQTDSGTAGHTVTLTAGTYDGSTTIATLNALGETLVLYGVTATRFVVVSNIGSVALS